MCNTLNPEFTLDPGLRLCRIQIKALTTSTVDHIIHIRITYGNGCLISFNVPSHEQHPDEALRKLFDISSTVKCT